MAMADRPSIELTLVNPNTLGSLSMLVAIAQALVFQDDSSIRVESVGTNKIHISLWLEDVEVSE